MIHLIYISSATRWPTEDDLVELLEQARARNQRQNITGLLLYDKATYLQVLEGEAEDVHDIFEAIKIDPRNNAVVKLVDEEIPARNYPDWRMGFRNLAHHDPGALQAYSDILVNGGLDKERAISNPPVSVKMLMSFARRAAEDSRE